MSEVVGETSGNSNGMQSIFTAYSSDGGQSVSVEIKTNHIPTLLFGLKLIEMEIQKQLVMSQMNAAAKSIVQASNLPPPIKNRY